MERHKTFDHKLKVKKSKSKDINLCKRELPLSHLVISPTTFHLEPTLGTI